MDPGRKELLTKERMGEIALTLVKEEIRRERVFDPTFKRGLGNIAKATGIPKKLLAKRRNKMKVAKQGYNRIEKKWIP